jgi:hypothetical protein
MEELNLNDMMQNSLEDACEINNNADYLEDNIIKINTDGLSNYKIDLDKFGEGINSVSYLCGIITALVNVGINPNKAMDYAVDKEATQYAMEHNLEMANIQKDISIETAKLNFVNKVDNF